MSEQKAILIEPQPHVLKLDVALLRAQERERIREDEIRSTEFLNALLARKHVGHVVRIL